MDPSLLEDYLNEIYAGQQFVPSYRINEIEHNAYPLVISKEIINDLDSLFSFDAASEFSKELKNIIVSKIDNSIKLKIIWT